MLKKEELILIIEREIKSKVIDINKTRSGNSSVTYKVTTEDKNLYYFKQGNNNYKLQSELAKKLNSLGIKSPEISAFSNEWIIEKGIEGKKLDISNKALASQVLSQFGEQLSLIHSIKTSGYGPLVSISRGKYQNYKEYYKNVSALIPKKYHLLINNYLKKDHQTCLNHGDVFPSHIYIDDKNNFLSLIDWDDIISAPKESDLSELAMNIGNDSLLWESFMSRYSKHNSYVGLNNRKLLIVQLLQAHESYEWYIHDKKRDLEMLKRIKSRIETSQRNIDNLW